MLLSERKLFDVRVLNQELALLVVVCHLPGPFVLPFLLGHFDASEMVLGQFEVLHLASQRTSQLLFIFDPLDQRLLLEVDLVQLALLLLSEGLHQVHSLAVRLNQLSFLVFSELAFPFLLGHQLHLVIHKLLAHFDFIVMVHLRKSSILQNLLLQIVVVLHGHCLVS